MIRINGPVHIFFLANKNPIFIYLVDPHLKFEMLSVSVFVLFMWLLCFLFTLYLWQVLSDCLLCSAPYYAFNEFALLVYKKKVLSDCHVTLWYYLTNDRGTHKKFPRLFFINYVKGQGGKHQNLIKWWVKEVVSLMLSASCGDPVGGVRAENLGG